MDSNSHSLSEAYEWRIMKCQAETDRWVEGEVDEGEEQIINGVREAGGAVWGDCGHNEHLLFNGLLSRAERSSGIHKENPAAATRRNQHRTS